LEEAEVATSAFRASQAGKGGVNGERVSIIYQDGPVDVAKLSEIGPIGTMRTIELAIAGYAA
jgi:hypothetical protein